MKRLLFALMMLIAAPAMADPTREVPEVSTGKIVDLGVVHSRYADPRRVVVWLPEGYDPKGKPYAVLYMHDGQNLFDKATAGYGMEWEIDEVAGRLMRERKMRPTIVVGIWNTPKRLQDYVPAKGFSALPPRYRDGVRALYGGKPLSDGYLKFLVRDLKPMIDRRFNVRNDRANTAILGSSMGALISLYAMDEYPTVFGGAGAMSTHWPTLKSAPGTNPPDADADAVSQSFRQYLSATLPSPLTHRLYLDDGSEMQDLQYARAKRGIVHLLEAHGYRQGRTLMVRNFPGQKHNEISWASRVDHALMFLLPPAAK